jgi:hypothetical protein
MATKTGERSQNPLLREILYRIPSLIYAGPGNAVDIQDQLKALSRISRRSFIICRKLIFYRVILFAIPDNSAYLPIPTQPDGPAEYGTIQAFNELANQHPGVLRLVRELTLNFDLQFMINNQFPRNEWLAVLQTLRLSDPFMSGLKKLTIELDQVRRIRGDVLRSLLECLSQLSNLSSLTVKTDGHILLDIIDCIPSSLTELTLIQSGYTATHSLLPNRNGNSPRTSHCPQLKALTITSLFPYPSGSDGLQTLKAHIPDTWLSTHITHLQLPLSSGHVHSPESFKNFITPSLRSLRCLHIPVPKTSFSDYATLDDLPSLQCLEFSALTTDTRRLRTGLEEGFSTIARLVEGRVGKIVGNPLPKFSIIIGYTDWHRDNVEVNCRKVWGGVCERGTS